MYGFGSQIYAKLSICEPKRPHFLILSLLQRQIAELVGSQIKGADQRVIVTQSNAGKGCC